MAQRDDVQNKAYIQERRIPPQNAGRPPSEGPRQGMPKIKQGEILVKQTYWDYEDFMNPNLPNPPKKCYYKVMSKEEFAKRQEICKDLEKTRNSILQQLEKEPCSSSDIDLGKAIEECTDAELSSQPLSLGPSVTSCPPQIQHQQQQQQQQQPPPTPSPQQQPPPTHQYQDQYSPQIRSQQARGGFKGPQQLSAGEQSRNEKTYVLSESTHCEEEHIYETMPKVGEGEILVKQTYWDYDDFMDPKVENPPKKYYYKIMPIAEYDRRKQFTEQLEKVRKTLIDYYKSQDDSSCDGMCESGFTLYEEANCDDIQT